MAAARRLKRVAVSQPGFMTLNASLKPEDLVSGKRKRLNKNKKKNWNKHSDVQDVEDFLEDIRFQERTTGGLISERSDDTLFFLDVGDEKDSTQNVVPPAKEKLGRRKVSRPLKVDLILQNNSLVPSPKNVLAHQQPNAKKLRHKAKKATQLAAEGKLPRKQKLLMKRRLVARTTKTTATEANNNPQRDYFDIWGEEKKETRDQWYLQQTGKKAVKRPEQLSEKPSLLPAVEVIAPGGSYNPDFFSHQALLLEAHTVEVKRDKAERKIERQLAVNKEDKATVETIFREEVEGLVEEEDEDEAAAGDEGEEDDMPVGAISLAEKKTEKQRRRERLMKIQEQRRQVEKEKTGQQQQLFQLRSIKASLKQRDARTKARQARRKAKTEAQKSMPRRLGRLKFQAPDLEIQLTNELSGSLRKLKPEGSVLKDRFKSLQKRNLIEPRERVKFRPRLKVKYVEKRSFKAIT